jgi:hypothetical protein
VPVDSSTGFASIITFLEILQESQANTATAEAKVHACSIISFVLPPRAISSAGRTSHALCVGIRGENSIDLQLMTDEQCVWFVQLYHAPGGLVVFFIVTANIVKHAPFFSNYPHSGAQNHPGTYTTSG